MGACTSTAKSTALTKTAGFIKLNEDNYMFNSFCITLLISGYIRSIHYRDQHPSEIEHLILSYFSNQLKYKIYSLAWQNVWYSDTDKEDVMFKLNYTKWNPYADATFDSIHSLYYGRNSFFIKSNRNELLVFGSNRDCALGFHEYDTQEFSKFTKLALPIDDCDEIAFMSNSLTARHSVLVTKQNKFYVWGYNSDHQLGNIKSKGFAVSTPTFSPELTDKFVSLNVTKIECGSDHTLFLCNNGSVWSQGNNCYGQCGFPRNKKSYHDRMELAIITQLHNIEDIVVGYQYNICLCSNGKVYCFGDCGWLGLGDDLEYIFVPIIHPFFKNKKVIHIATGEYHSLCVTSKGEAYLFGSNEEGQIDGNTEIIKDKYCVPYLFKTDEKVIYGWLGKNITLLLLQCDEFVMFGEEMSTVCLGRTRLEECQLKLQSNEAIRRIICHDGVAHFVVG